MFIAVLPDCLDDPCRYVLRENYLTALSQQGALPIVVPYDIDHLASYLDACGGLMIIGGGFTIDPRLFGQEKQTPMTLKPRRTEAELAFFHGAYKRHMPILGICGGAQLINVALGGSLIQHLPTTHPQALNHLVEHPAQPAHDIELVPNTLLSHILEGASRFGVNSSHLQAVDRLGHNLRINAIAPDGIIEGIESTEHPFCMGLQWHPEYQIHSFDSRLFQGFVHRAVLYYQHM